MEKDVGEGLPDAQAGDKSTGNQPKGVNKPRVTIGQKRRDQNLEKVDAGASENKDFDAGRDEATPVKANPRRAKPGTHGSSLRRRTGLRQKRSDEARTDREELASLIGVQIAAQCGDCNQGDYFSDSRE